jgi:cytochrome P450
MKASEFPDPFKELRKESGLYQIEDNGENVDLILRLRDVRKCAHNASNFNSGAAIPGRIVIPSEENIRDVRQIPVEVDSPEHKDYRSLLDPWFKRPLEEEYQDKLNKLIDDLFTEVLSNDKFEVVHDFSLKLQSRALTLLLNTSIEEAETWIEWGSHVFRGEEGELVSEKANVVDDYILKKIEEASLNPGEDLYSVLLNAEINGIKLTKEEVHGVMNLTFAGGRDTVINALTNMIAYFGDHAERLTWLSENPEYIGKSVEELVRYFTPLTHLGRISKEDSVVCEHAIKAGSKVGLGWASANRDETVFDQPNEVQLDRKVNPHVGFGFGIHNCLGATHARQILRKVLSALVEKVSTIEIHQFIENIETIGEIKRKVGFKEIIVTLHPK